MKKIHCIIERYPYRYNSCRFIFYRYYKSSISLSFKLLSTYQRIMKVMRTFQDSNKRSCDKQNIIYAKEFFIWLKVLFSEATESEPTIKDTTVNIKWSTSSLKVLLCRCILYSTLYTGTVSLIRQLLFLHFTKFSLSG